MCNIPISPNLFTALTANQYIDKLYVFGSRATLDDDEFSDIDMTAITSFPTGAEDYTRKTLEGQFGIIATYTISQNNHEIARSFFLNGMSLFHKLDIGFSLPNQTKLFPNSTLLFNNNHAKQPDKKSVKTWTESPRQHKYLVSGYFDRFAALCQTSASPGVLVGVQVLSRIYRAISPSAKCRSPG